MTRKLLAAALLSAFVLPPVAYAASSPEPVKLDLIRGGAVYGELVVDGRYVHIPTGRQLATWDYNTPTAPQRTGTTEPAGGPIISTTRQGQYLYAAWRGSDGISGVATYSLANPAAPKLVADSHDYNDADNKFMVGIVAANGHLYLFDNNHGLYVGDLTDPAHPHFVRSAIESVPVQYSQIKAFGNTIQASGRTWLGTEVALHIYDVSNPDAPQLLSSHQVDGFDSFSLNLAPGLAIGIGNQLSLFDTSNPMQMVRRSWMDVPPATRGARVGSYFYSFGWADGIDVWNVGNIDNPLAAGHLDILTLGGRQAAALGSTTLLLQTDTDLMHTIDVRTPGKPRRTATGWLPAGVDARDIALYRGKPVLAQPNYGLTINDAITLAPLARFEARLPFSLEDRSFEQVDVVGDRAYLAAWGAGVFAVDLSNPKSPKELGSYPFWGAAVMDVEGQYAYVAKWTNGGLFGVLDISNPADMKLTWQDGLTGQPYRLKVANGHAFLAESAEYGTTSGGVRIYDLARPDRPKEIAQLNQGCGNAFDLSVDAELSLVYLACQSGLQIVDVSNPAKPVLASHYDIDNGEFVFQFQKVAHRGNRAWYADDRNLREFDVSDPTHPKLLKATPLGHRSPQRLFADPNSGRVYLLGGENGVHVFSTTLPRPGGGDPGDKLPIPSRPVAGRP